MPLDVETLFRFRSFSVTPQQIQSLLFLVLPDRASNQQSTALETLHINTIDVVNTHLI